MTSTDRNDRAASVATDLILRSAEPNEATSIADLFIAAREAAYPAMPPPAHRPEQIQHWFEDQLGPDREPGRETWLAQRQDGIVGYLVLDAEWLHSLYVAPELTGEGIGTALLDLAKALRPKGFGLWVFEANDGARRFYLRHGLRERERTDGSDNEEQAPDVRMVWVPRPEPDLEICARQPSGGE